MIPFDFIRADTLTEALEFLGQNGKKTRVIAGGTDLLVQLRAMSPRDPAAPKYVMNISGIDELKGIRQEDGKIVLGPLATHAEIAASEMIRNQAPLLRQACSTVGAEQHRSVGTIGGNIINASPAADAVPALIALNAEVAFRSTRGGRVSPLRDIFVKPYLTDIQPDELLIRIAFPALPPEAKTAFIKLGRRNALAIARMNIAVVIILDGKVIKETRVSPGSATPLPDRIAAAEEVLIGKEPNEELFRGAARKVSEEMIKRSGVRWSTPYKKPVIEALVARALRTALKE